MDILKFSRLLLFFVFVVNSVQVFSGESTRPFQRLVKSGDIVGKLAVSCTLPPNGSATVYISGLSIVSKVKIGEPFKLLNVPAGTYDVVIEPPQILTPTPQIIEPKVVHDVVVQKRKVTDLGEIDLCDNQCSENNECSEDSYCAKPVGECGGLGQCALKGDICPQVFDPVCGCDGNTYSNSCLAAVAGVNVVHKGECDRKVICPTVWMPVCGVDGKTYGNRCEAAGVEIKHEGECRQGQGRGELCGGIANLQCKKPMICDFEATGCDPLNGDAADCAGVCVLPKE